MLSASVALILITILWVRANLKLKQLQGDLRQRDGQLLTVMQELIQGTMIIQQHTVRVANRVAATILGYSTPQSLMGQDIRSILTPDSGVITEGNSPPRPLTLLPYEVQSQHCDGSTIWILCQVSPILWDRQMMQLITFTDISAQKQLEQDVVSISELEQQRLSHDLHDAFGQQLTGIAFIGKALEQTLKSEERRETAQMAHMNALLQQALGQLRGLINNRHPAQIESHGLEQALENLAKEIQTVFGVSVAFISNAPSSRLDSFVSLHLYRIAQEAINNIVKHAYAQHIGIEISESSLGFQLIIKDDGVGITELSRSRNGIGLRSMHYRTRLIGATIEISRVTSGGTQVCCTVPMTLNIAA